MKDIVDAVANDAQADPMKVAERPNAGPKRFYEKATVEEDDGAWKLLLDGRPVRTPGRQKVAVASKAVAEAMAEEWNAQGTHVAPLTMPVTRIVNSAVDGVAQRMDEVRDDVREFAGSDLLCYRAEGPDGLIQRQREHWDPVLESYAERLGARFVLTEGVMPVAQSDEALAVIGAELADIADPSKLAATHVATTITGSALLVLAVARGSLDAEAAWRAAHVDEDWNRELWGEDEEATERRRQRRRDYEAAVLIILS